MKKVSEMYSLWIDDHSVETKNVTIEELHEFKGHPFKVEKDNAFYELMKSIEDNGVLVPLMVRPKQYGYEIISGHRRKAACEYSGIHIVPVTIMNLTDEEAMIAMTDSNLQREHIRPSEKAFAYKMKLEAMKQQGKKIDSSLSQVGTKSTKIASTLENRHLRSDEILARQAGESRNQIARYIRLTNLIPKILDMVDDEKIAFTIAVELSYLEEEEQYELYAVMDLEQCTPSLSQANRLKRMSQSGQLDMDTLYKVLVERKSNQMEQIKIRSDSLEQYFPSDYSPKQKVELIEQLVKEWHKEQQIKNKSVRSGKSR